MNDRLIIQRDKGRRSISAQLLLLFVSLASVALAHAQSAIPRLADNAPDTYTVERGDTLWDISALFLNEPWRWPELWSVNPDVRDPNLIYPGDVLYLRWNNGKPGVYLTSASRAGVTKLSPKMRSEPLTSAIPEIPRDVIDPFIANHRFETAVDRSMHPRVIGGAGGRLISGMGDSVYVAGSLSRGVETYDVVRPSQELNDPKTGEPLGQLMISVGRVALPAREPMLMRRAALMCSQRERSCARAIFYSPLLMAKLSRCLSRAHQTHRCPQG